MVSSPLAGISARSNDVVHFFRMKGLPKIYRESPSRIIVFGSGEVYT
jgi:hypothetical protein